MNNHNAPIQMDTSSSQQQRHQHQQQHPSGIGLNEVLSLIQTQDDMRELLIRDRRLLPSKKSALSSNAYYRGVFQGVLWCPHTTRVQLKTCFKPPTIEWMCTRIVHLVTARDQKCGIDLLKKNFPDRQWCLFALMELEPESDIFKPSYNPKMARAAAHDVVIEPMAGLLEGMRSMKIGGVKRKGKHGSANLILNEQ